MRWLEKARSSKRPVWLHDTAYTYRLLAADPQVWLDPASFAQWRRKSLQLLNPDVAVLDVAGLARAWPRKTDFIRDTAFVQHVTELLHVLRASTGKPLALDLPPPALTGLDEDAIDDLVADMARLLRAQSEAGMEVILLREPGPRLDLYTSLINVAHHHRWEIGIHTPTAAPPNLGSFDFAVGPQPAAGVELGSDFWQGAPAPSIATSCFYFVAIPPHAQPEYVLARLGTLP